LPHDQRWFISRTGFTDPARRFAQAYDLWITDAQGLERLQGGI
jgi:hypothetical protein